MPRRRDESVVDMLLEVLKIAPVWFGPAFAGFLFVSLRFILPALLPTTHAGIGFSAIIRPLLAAFSFLFPGVVLVLWMAAEVWKLMNRRLLDTQTGIASIREIPWQDFERLVSEAYRRKGYRAEVVGSSFGDGGIDVRLTAPGELVLVQCKRWKEYKVGVTTVRELLGVVVSEKANRGILVTSGRFTQDALAFARQNPQIELLDGQRLAELIRDVHSAASATTRPPVPPPPPIQAPAAPSCPVCGQSMVLRTARKGANAGANFWGCSQFAITRCRGIRPAGQ